jgi:hypothetical protein
LLNLLPVNGQGIVTIEKVCSNDSEVNELFPDTNYGAEDIISIKREGDNFTCVYVAFDISDKQSSFIKAEFAVNLWYIMAPDQGYDMQLVELGDECDKWSETNITWNNKPEFYIVISPFKVDNTNQIKTYTFDITNHTENCLNGYVPLVLEAIDEGECRCLSKEYSPSNSSDAPRLILSYMENLTKIPFSDLHTIGLIIAFGIAVKIIQIKNKKQI